MKVRRSRHDSFFVFSLQSLGVLRSRLWVGLPDPFSSSTGSESHRRASPHADGQSGLLTQAAV